MAPFKKLHRRHGRDTGFTLVELMIVITILAILASLSLPSIMSSSEVSAESALVADMAMVRSAISLYRTQHSGQMPGWVSGSVAGNPSQTFLDQMLLYSDVNGRTSSSKSATYSLGPYIMSRTGFPACPVGAKESNNQVLVGSWGSALVADAKETQAWKYSYNTSEFICNDTTLDSSGAPYSQY